MSGRLAVMPLLSMRAVLLGVAVLVASVSPAVAQVVIDEFTTAQATLSDPPGGASSVSTGGADILGFRRDLAVDLGTGAGPVSAGVAGGVLTLSLGDTTPDSLGRVTVTWDGDADPGTLAFTGLGGIDLTSGGAAAFALTINGSAAGSGLLLTVYSDSSSFSSVARRLPEIAAPTEVLIGFGELLQAAGAAAPADLADVGAIVLRLQPAEGGSVVIDRFGAVAPTLAAQKVDLLADDGSEITEPVPPGTRVRYRVTVTNTGGTAESVNLADVLDGQLTLDAASVRSQAVARADQYRTAPGTAVDTAAGALPSLLANDSDADGDTLAAAAETVATAQGGSAAIGADGHFVYTPPMGFAGVDDFAYSLVQAAGDPGIPVTATATILVENQPPVVGAGRTLTYTENDGAVAIDTELTVVDPDGATLVGATVQITGNYATGEDVLAFTDTASITGSWNPAAGTLTLAGSDTVAGYQAALRTVTYENTSETPDVLDRTVTWIVSDGLDDSAPATSTVTVAAADDPPVAVDDAATVAEDAAATAVDVLANDTDLDGGDKSVSSITQPTNGTVVITGGGTGLTYEPDADYCNTPPGTTLDTFTYTLSPGSSSATVTVTVTCEDDPPTAAADAATVDEDSGANAIDVLGNDTDVDGGPISIASASDPASGTVVITGGGTGLTYQPDPNYCNAPPGTTLDTFTYTLSPGGSSATVTVTVNCIDDPPVAVADSATVVEDSGATAIDVLVNDTDVDSGDKSVDSVTQPANGAVVITGGGTGLSYTPNPNYCNTPPGSTPDTFTYTLTPGSSSTTVTVTVTCVDDPPVAVADLATVFEDSGANAINVLFNDTDVDGGPISIASVTQPANGTVIITGGGTGLAYQPSLNYCNNPPGTTPDTFTYTLSPGSSSTSVSVAVTCVNDPPVAGADAFDFVGNTELRVDHGPAATPHVLETTTGGTGVLQNDGDPVEGDPITIVGLTVGGCIDISAPFDCSDPAVGRVQLDADGSFSFQPAPGDAGATETFQYTLSDGTDTAVGTVTLTRFERVWYVKNDAPAGGNGTSAEPFNAITAANLNDNGGDGDLTDDLDAAGDYLFVHFGAGTTTGLSGGLLLEGGQRLIGEHVGLSLPVNLNGNGAPTLLVAAAPGSRPLLDDTVAGTPDGVAASDVLPAEIAGLSLAGNVNAIDIATTAAFAGSGTLIIRDNVVRSTGAEGVDLNLAGTGTVTLALHDNTVTATGTAIDIVETGTGSLTVTRFDDNVVNGNTGGSGIVLGAAIFDSNPGAAGLQTVDGGTTVIGASGNGVGGAGLVLANVQGDLHFSGNLNIFADNGTGLSVTGTGVGFQLRVNSGGAPTGIVEATGGPAVAASAAGLDLRLTSLKSTNSTSTGVSLTNVTGTFSAESGSSISNATGTDFLISGGTANVTYKGTITDDVGQLVSVSGATAGTKSFEGAITDGNDGDGGGISVSGNGGATISFSGGVVLSTGANPAFAATGGGTVTVTGTANTLATTTATALNVVGTTIGATGLTFRSIASNGGGNPGIVLNNTGTSGGLTVSGTGGAGSGGTIQNKTGDGISLTNTRSVSLSSMVIDTNDGSGIRGDDVTGFSLIGSSVTNNGDTTGGTEAGLRFDELLGTCAITNSTISGSIEDNIRLTPASGVLTNLAISGTTIGPNNAVTGGNGLAIVGTGTAQVTVNITGSTFRDNGASGVLTSFTDSASHTVNISTSTFEDNNTAIDLGVELNSDLNFTIENNASIVRSTANAINIVSGTGATNNSDIRGTISNNTIGNGAPDSGSQNAFGIAVDLRGDVDAVLAITNNTVRNTDIEGIFVQSRLDNDADGEIGLIDLTLRDNTVSAPDDNSAFPFGFVYGTRIESRNTSNLCLDIAGNTSAGVGGAEHFRVRQRDTSTFRAERLALGAQTAATMQTFVAAQNDLGSTASATEATSPGYTGVANGTCRKP